VTDGQGPGARRHNKSGGVTSRKYRLHAHGRASEHVLATLWSHIGLMT
jgi:hypothetical protein